ncbi:MAG: NYN domain-containing protein [Ignavibacteriaceae bacterium]|nr:NYN domain-containing protein [Ignavibacteriaceae bacterium]
MLKYIIDGNNLIGKISKLSSHPQKQLQQSRELLSFKLDNIFANKRTTVYVYFDGFEGLPIKTQKVKIIYSQKVSADEAIKKQISIEKNPRNLLVVSSDREIMNFAKACSAKTLTREEFYQDLLKSKKENEEEKRIAELQKKSDEFKKLFTSR